MATIDAASKECRISVGRRIVQVPSLPAKLSRRTRKTRRNVEVQAIRPFRDAAPTAHVRVAHNDGDDDDEAMAGDL